MASEWARERAREILGILMTPFAGDTLPRDEGVIARALDEARKMGEPTPPPAPVVKCPECGTACTKTTPRCNCRMGSAEYPDGSHDGKSVYTPIAPPMTEQQLNEERSISHEAGERRGYMNGREAGLIEGRREGERAALKRVYDSAVHRQRHSGCFVGRPYMSIIVSLLMWNEIEQAGKS